MVNSKYILLLSLASGIACSGELVYEPINPSFGGNPLNTTHLQYGASFTQYDPPDNNNGFDFEEESALDNLAASLESRLISQLLADIGNGNTGQLETNDFFLNVVDDNGTLIVQIVDKTTGESTEISVSGLTPDL
ncbi:curli production assembly protein CsgF [Vibrio sp. SCSIO 43140]|uniref:curli assembly protein CsgF n=1 Tax=Vibrio sp. SCSIO 43140 TaxID=2819100 RepID=UPI002075F96B|nr:curli assembly protein CsgF [Vibrio sp. SCSIO 43140]USD62696.1 curli production assembly protein CsgF [Vibrio sp. SCSIO 43140]